MAFQVIVLPRARQELQSLYDWIAERSVDGANRWADAFDDAIKRLGDDPESFGFAPENGSHREVIRQLLFKTRHGRTYRALFFVRGEKVLVVHFRGPGQRVMRSEEIDRGET